MDAAGSRRAPPRTPTSTALPNSRSNTSSLGVQRIPAFSRTAGSNRPAAIQRWPATIGRNSWSHNGVGIRTNFGLGIRMAKMSSVAWLISRSSRQMRSQYSWNSSQVSGTGRMLIPYMRYHCTCSSNSWRFSASVKPPQKYSATLTISMKNVACAQ